jgi:ADP-heptose:LPS heptosyltransferase
MRSERLLVSMKDYIGDAVMTEPMIAAVESAFARVVLHAGSPVDQVLWRPNFAREFFCTARPKSAWDVVVHASKMRSKAFDAAILVNRSFRSALTVRLAGIKTRIGHDTECRRALLTGAVPYDRARFEALSQLDLAALAGVEASPRVPCLSTTEEENRRGRQLAEGATIGIQAGARWPGKQLPVHVTIEVARSIIASGEKVALLGAVEEIETVNRVAEALGSGYINLVERTSVRDTLGILTSLRAMVGGDTGLMHLAAGVGCATVTVFGPTCHSKWAHEYPPHRTIKAPNGDMNLVEAEQVISSLQGVLPPVRSSGPMAL